MVDSTNERAKALARAGAPHGTLVTAAEQTAGRGRQGRSWLARPGSAVLMSVVLRDPARVATARRRRGGGRGGARRLPSSSGPTTCCVDGRKLAGILVEGRPQEGWAVLGIGLNVSTPAADFPAELRDIATSLAAALGEARGARGGPGRAARAAGRTAGEPAGRGAGRVAAPRRAARLSRCSWDGGAGTAAGIDGDGSLLVDTDSGQVALAAGEVHLQR